MASQAYRMIADDLSKIDLLTEDMKKLVIEGARKTVNIMAANSRRHAVENVKRDFITRNNFTEKSITYAQSKLKNKTLDSIEAKVGVLDRAAYMQRQEEGGFHTDPGGHRLAIPTNQARGGSVRRKVSEKLWIKNVKKSMYTYDRTSHGTGKSSLVALAAKATGNQIGFIKYNKNIYTVSKFTRRDGKVSFKMNLIYFRSLEQTRTPAQPWLQPACEKEAPQGQAIFNNVMNKIG